MNAGQESVLMPSPNAQVLPAVMKLLHLRLRIMVNSFRHAKRGSKIGLIILYTLLLGFGVFVFGLSKIALDFVRSPDMARVTGVDFTAVLVSIPALILSALFLGTLLTSFGVLLQALYLAGDMDFLIATPVPIRAVFIAKLLQAVIPNFAILALLGLPILFGLGASSGYGAVYYPLVILVMIALALAAAGLASLLVMLVVRVMSPRRAAEILAFFGALFGFACSQLGNFANLFGRDIHVSGTRLAGILLLAEVRWLPFELGRSGTGRLGTKSLGFRCAAPGRHAGRGGRRLCVCPDHRRTVILLRLGRHADRRTQKDKPPTPGSPCQDKRSWTWNCPSLFQTCAGHRSKGLSYAAARSA